MGKAILYLCTYFAAYHTTPIATTKLSNDLTYPRQSLFIVSTFCNVTPPGATIFGDNTNFPNARKQKCRSAKGANCQTLLMIDVNEI